MSKQQIFLELCRERKNTNNFANELSELLGINKDAAYRRIRGDTPLIFSEIQKICLHYNLSFDSIINYRGHTFPFQFISMFNKGFQILQYLVDIEFQMKFMARRRDSKFLITAMDIPYFRLFGFKNLSRFKLFFWQRSVLNIPEFNRQKFNATKILPEYDRITNNIHKLYHGINSTEIWSPESLDDTLTQIQYYLDSGLFNSAESAHLVCDDLMELLNKVEQSALVGKKHINEDGEIYAGDLELYQSDVFLSNNFIQASYQGKVYSYVSFNSFNSLMSHSSTFSDECSSWIEQIRVKSVLLSTVSEKLRYQFFKGLRRKVNELRAGIE